MLINNIGKDKADVKSRLEENYDKPDAGINLAGYYPPRATNFFPSKSPPQGQLFSAKLGPPG